jgi:hypothetical protein
MFVVLISTRNVNLLTMGVEVAARQVESFCSRPHFKITLMLRKLHGNVGC